MYDEGDLLPISALQHLAFCERQWALIHLERLWAENPLTVEGHHLRDRTHQPDTESRGDLRIARGLRLRSLRLGLSGIADVVEFQRMVGNGPECHSERSEESCSDPQTQARFLAALGMTKAGVSLPGVRGLWQPFPVEYKRGRPKPGPYDEIQLCAQALCLEEMLGVAIPAGALYYGRPHQRQEVALNAELREQTEKLAARLHELFEAGQTPPARYEKKCESCSLLTLCMPKTTGGGKSVDRYLAGMLEHDGG